MKRTMSLILAAVWCCMLLAGCGGNQDLLVASFHNKEKVEYETYAPMIKTALKQIGVTEEPQKVQIGSSKAQDGAVEVNIGFEIEGRRLVAEGYSTDGYDEISYVRENKRDGICYWTNKKYEGDLYRFDTGEVDPFQRVTDEETRKILSEYPLKGGKLTASTSAEEGKESGANLSVSVTLNPSAFSDLEEAAEEYIRFAEFFCSKGEELPWFSCFIVCDAGQFNAMITRLLSSCSLVNVYASSDAVKSMVERAYAENPYFQKHDESLRKSAEEEEEQPLTLKASETNLCKSICDMLPSGSIYKKYNRSGRASFGFTIPISEEVAITEMEDALGDIATIILAFEQISDKLKALSTNNFTFRFRTDFGETLTVIQLDCKDGVPQVTVPEINPKYKGAIQQALMGLYDRVEK